jgi:hypothetical protein
MKPGELREFRNGRDPITKEINWVLGFIIEVVEHHNDPIMDRCKVLTTDGRIRYMLVHGSKEVA